MIRNRKSKASIKEVEEEKRPEDALLLAAIEGIAENFRQDQFQREAEMLEEDERKKQDFVKSFWEELNKNASVKGYLLPQEPSREIVYPEHPADALPQPFYDDLETIVDSVLGSGYLPAEMAEEGYPRRGRIRTRSRNRFEGAHGGKKRTKRYRKKRRSLRSK